MWATASASPSMFEPKWANAYLVFDEDDDDHRWERVEIYYPGDPYSTKRWDKDHKGGICGHPQSDTLGDRGEWDTDFSGRGKLYIGKWDGKIHLLGAETGAWTVDRHADYWGSWPNMGDSSTSGALKVEEVVLYRDTDNNGFFDEIAFDYDGDKTPETTISLLDAAYGGDEAEVLDTVELGLEGAAQGVRRHQREVVGRRAARLPRGVAQGAERRRARRPRDRGLHRRAVRPRVLAEGDGLPQPRRAACGEGRRQSARGAAQAALHRERHRNGGVHRGARVVRRAAGAWLALAALAIAGAPRAEAATPSEEQMKRDLATIYETSAAQPLLLHRTQAMRRLEPLLAQQARYLIGTLKPWDKDASATLLTAGKSDEHSIRPNAHTAYGLAVMARCIPADARGEVSAGEARDKAVSLLRFLLPTHGAGEVACADGKQWRGQWQSALWAFYAGKAAWLMWDDLDPRLRWLAARMVCDEADRFVGKTPPAQVELDTKAEENAWNSTVVALAACMFPNHPHREAWRETAIRWAATSFATRADLDSTAPLDGRPLREWMSGPNIHDDFTLENHNRVHPDYMNTIHLCMDQALVYRWAGLPVPQALFHNWEPVYRNLKVLDFPDGNFLYPNGQDWGLHRNPHWILTHACAGLLGGDPDATRLMIDGIDVAERMARRTPQAGIHLPEEFFFPSTQHFLLDMLATVYLLSAQEGDGSAPTPEDALWRAQEGIHVFDAGRFALSRSPNAVASISWGRQSMGMVLPMGRDLLLSPNERSLIGSVRASRQGAGSPGGGTRGGDDCRRRALGRGRAAPHGRGDRAALRVRVAAGRAHALRGQPRRHQLDARGRAGARHARGAQRAQLGVPRRHADPAPRGREGDLHGQRRDG